MAEQKCRECGHGNPAAALYCERCGKSVHAGDRDPLVGQTIASRFYIVERIGQGTAGTLYRAEHVTLRRRMAVKLLHKHLAQSDDAVERFRREAITVCEIDNDHIPQVHDFGRAEDGRLFFAMEFLEGEPLSALLGREGPLAIERCVDILAQVADGLMEAHTLGYVHRDLRPRSIFLSKRRGRQDFVKILDFGLAKLVQPEVDAQRTAMGMTYGDPRYMAPEQARGETVDRRADIYSLGALGYEMLTGEAPFIGEGSFAILGKVLDAPVPRVRERRPDCSAWLESVVRVALSKAPTERFQTVSQFLDALERKQVLQTQPAMPGASKAVAGKIVPVSPGLRALPSTPITPISTSLSPLEHAVTGSTQAMPTVAPSVPAAEEVAASGTIRQTLAYPAVSFTAKSAEPVRAPVAAKAAPAASSTDEIRMLGSAAPVPAPVAKVTPAAAAKPAPAVTPKSAISASLPVVAPKSAISSSVPAVKPAPAVTPKSAISSSVSAIKPALGARPAQRSAGSSEIQPTTPTRSDPTPRTVSAMLEQEAMGWLEAADSITDQQPVQPEVPATPAPVAKLEPAVAVAKPVAAVKPALAAVKPALAAVKPALAARPALSPLDSDATMPTPKLAVEDDTRPVPKSAPPAVVAVSAPAVEPDQDTELQPKLDPIADLAPASAESPLPSSESPKDAAAAGWFAGSPAPAEEHFADDDSYIIARPRVPRRMLIIGAAVVGALFIGWLALRSPSRPPTPTVTPPVPAETQPAPSAENPPPAPPSPETATPPPPAPAGTEGPQPLAVSSAPEEVKAPEPKPEKKPVAEAPKPEKKPVAEAPKPEKKPVAEAPKPEKKPVAEAPKPEKKPMVEAPKPEKKPVAEAPKQEKKPVAEAPKPAQKAAEPTKKPADAVKPVAEAPKPAQKAAEPAKPGTKVATATPSPAPAKPGSAIPDTLTLKAPEFPKPTATDENLAGKAQEALALINLGKKKLEDGEPEAAAQSFTRATELDPKNPSAFGGLGEAAFEQGDFEEAIRQLNKAIKLAPRRLWYQELLASAQFKIGKYKEAIETAKKVLKVDANSKRAKQILEQAEKKL